MHFHNQCVASISHAANFSCDLTNEEVLVLKV